MEKRINDLCARMDALLEQQKKVFVLLENTLSTRVWLSPQEALFTSLIKPNNDVSLGNSHRFLRGVSEEMELAPELAPEDEDKRLFILKHLGHVDITRNKQDPNSKKDCLEFIQQYNIPKPLIITVLYNVKGIKPTKKEVSRQLQKLYVWEKRYQKGGIDALKDRRGRPLSS
ncbi:helix-turn-helix domain-containing protein [Helicobacter cetorum]|uniref:helix-turn-helix domain-containing protein n=1 Tax=Helicobacter cetorum TaxID=138563 RepID=UPI000CF09A0F|nr:helix-turn-helix domain-containing protein [Helicobacter cetorum]